MPRRLLVLNVLLALTLAGNFWGRNLEQTALNRSGFLREVVPARPGWQASDAQIEPRVLGLLEPDDYIWRTFTAPTGEWVEVLIIAGHRKRTVHTPSYCLPGAGWETMARSSETQTIGQRDMSLETMVLARDGHYILVSYLFTDGYLVTTNLLRLQGRTMWRRLGATVPEVALLRVMTPLVGGPDALKKAQHRIQKTLDPIVPRLLAALRESERGSSTSARG